MTNVSNEEAVKKQVALLRDGYLIGVYPDYIPLMCNECDEENLKFSILNDLGYEQISLTRLGISEPFHRASLLGFNSDDGLEWFVVDPTYGQFFKNETFRGYMEENYGDFSSEILTNGYVRCTLSNMLSYVNGFVLSDAYCSDLDVDKVYRNVGDILSSNGIIRYDDAINHEDIIDIFQMPSPKGGVKRK